MTLLSVGIIMRRIHPHRYLSSYEPITLRTKSAYSILCNEKTSCVPIPTTDCKTGITVKCTLNFCPSDSIPSGRHCVQTDIATFSSFSDAKEACSFRVLSLPRESDRIALMQMATEVFDKEKTYFTSGYRRGSQWLWDDETPIEFDVYGEGRCLAVRSGAFRAVDCNSPGTALCEVARECVYHSEYNGKLNSSQGGFPCMKWNDPSVLFYGLSANGQSGWDHNFCRIVNEEPTPSCFTSPKERKPCDLPHCPDSPSHLELKADLASSKCGVAFFPCRDSGRCLANDFRCDYEPDCDDASDEEDCEDFLSHFELIGTLKLADKITEIWTYIPHAQGCARRCKESSLVCEAFSYEPRTQTCLLTDSPDIGTNLAVKPSSQFYRKRFSTRDVHYDLLNSVLRVSKNNTWANVCDDGFSADYATSICSIFGYG
ncbi:Low-density lipoprotein receptor domain class A [Trichostrongylus colubriformis]|uniref:Low-density lipoprotein receptor domain class A n=1 Tax=Trichostrongylus colubriformis TaxID=6319 RepID=A0AAN8FYL3_TRICO